MLTKPQYIFLKAYFAAFGKAVLDRFASNFEEKGMGFTTVTVDKLLPKFREEVKELEYELSRETIDFDKVLLELADVANMCFMMFIQARESKNK